MQIPVVKRQVGLDTPQLAEPKNPGVVRAAFGEDVAQAVGGLGESAQNFSLALKKHMDERQLQKDEADAAQREVGLRTEVQDLLYSPEVEKVNVNGSMIDRPKGYLNRPLELSAGSDTEFRERALKVKQKYLTGVTNPDVAKKLSLKFDNLLSGYEYDVLKHEAKQGRESMIGKNESLLKLQAADASSVGDPSKLVEAIQNAAQTQENIDRIKGSDSATIELNKKNISGEIASKAAESVLTLTGDLEKAQQLLDTAKDSMPKDKYVELSALLPSMKKKIEEERKLLIKKSLIANEQNITGRVAAGDMSLSVTDMANLITTEKVSPEFGQAYIKYKISPNSVDPAEDKNGFAKYAEEVFKAGNEDQMNAAIKIALNGGSDGKISQEDTQYLLKYAIERGQRLTEKNPVQDYIDGAWKSIKDFFGQFNKEQSNAAQSRFIKEVVKNPDQTPETLNTLTLDIMAQHNPNYRVFLGKKPGDIVTLPNGAHVKYNGFANGDVDIEALK